jgi:SAM-dependent methyltransferase
MLDQAIRFGAILKRAEFRAGGNLLEVGSGETGIGAFIAEPFFGVDIHFEVLPSFTAVKASATALPFGDGVFSRVICSDVLEHLPAEERAGAIEELIRVTKGTLFLACPTGRCGWFLDSALHLIYRFLRISLPTWLPEHFRNRLPDGEDIRRILKENGVTFAEICGESCLVHLPVSFLISTRRLNRFWRFLFYRRPGRAQKVAGIATLGGLLPYRRLWQVKCNI